MNNTIYENLIDNIPDFPKKGVMFKDFSPLLATKMDDVLIDMGKNINWDEIDLVLGIESRGFILGSALAAKFKKGFLPIRKKGKLPPPTHSEEYTLEYGTDTLEIRVNQEAKNIVLVDDVLATGGTLKAALRLCEKNSYHVKSISMLINLKFLNNLHEELEQLHAVLNYE